MSSAPAGTLYLVATPIGNLGDLSARAVEVLKSSAIVACEDTRRSRALFTHYGVAPRRIESYHAHNADHKTGALIRELAAGVSVALVTDAGTPGISDPGVKLVMAAVEAGVTVCPIPGPCAPVLALTASGFPSHRFVFEGFLPRKKGRRTMFEAWREEKRTIVFFEAANRIVKTLEDIRAALGPDVRVCVAREMTKIHEEFLRGTVEQVRARLSERPAVKGEVTVALWTAGAMAPEMAGEGDADGV